VRIVGGLLDSQTDLDGQLAGERHELEISDPQHAHFDIERPDRGRLGLRPMHLQ
jgi:hypothetical protein